MKLKAIALAAVYLTCINSYAQSLKIETGKQQKVGMYYSHTNMSYKDSDGVLTSVYAKGMSNSVNSIENVAIVKYDDNLNPTVTPIDVEKKTGRVLRSGGIGYFNNNILLFGVNKDETKKWKYSIFTLDQKGDLTGKEIKLNYEFKAQLSVASYFSTAGFVKSPNNKYGAVYVCHSSEKKSEIFVSAIVFDNDMNVISNISTRIPDYDEGAVIPKAFIDDDGNLIGVMKDGVVSGLTVIPAMLSADHGLYAFIAKKGATDMTYVKIPSGKKIFQTVDMESTGDGDFRIFGIYKNPKTGHATIDGADCFDINIDGDVEKGTGIDNPEKFNIFSKSTMEARLLTFEYRVLPSIVTVDNSTIFIVQKVNNPTIPGSRHFMDVYMFKFSDKGLEWDLRIPAYTSNFPTFPVIYDKKTDKLSLIYCQKDGHEFTAENAPTPLDDNNSGMANFYITEVDKDGDAKTVLVTKEKYPYPFDYFTVGKKVYERINVGLNDEKIRRVEIED